MRPSSWPKQHVRRRSRAARATRKRITPLPQAFGQDPDFFAFYRSMNAYQSSLKGDNTTVILSPDSDFLRYFGGGPGQPRRYVPPPDSHCVVPNRLAAVRRQEHDSSLMVTHSQRCHSGIMPKPKQPVRQDWPRELLMRKFTVALTGMASRVCRKLARAFLRFRCNSGRTAGASRRCAGGDSSTGSRGKTAGLRRSGRTPAADGG